ncbi:MAG: hypothetical protein GF329_09935, partial [Candidatus Lokiarchaeota archaeon]|nr:hypothetical protein [Candidatus Lokiarchaeota archaeon]
MSLNKHKNNKLIIICVILSFGLTFSLYFGLNYNNSTLNNSNIPEGGVDAPLSTQEIIPANLTREWEPIILTTANFGMLNGLSYGNIRILYYDADTAKWVSVPFQIDEWGASNSWEDGTYTTGNPSAVTGGFIGPDSNGMDSAGGVPDELVFYAHDGARVPQDLWWQGDSGGTYPNRVEINITDPVDGGRSWAYLYFDLSSHGDPSQTWVDYPSLGFNSSQSRAFGADYNVVINQSNPDIENDIYSSSGARDLLNESFKSYSNVTFWNTTLEDSHIYGEGSWGDNIYSDSKTEMGFPENTTTPDGYIHEGIHSGGSPIVSGPIRTIINKRKYNNYSNSIYPFYMIQHETQFFYMDSKIVNITRSINPESSLVNVTIDYDYSFVTSLNISNRDQYTVYEGWRNQTMITNIPNGVENEAGERNSTLGPLAANPKNIPDINPEVPDYIFFTSPSSISTWVYSPRDDYHPNESGVYWRDDNSTTEIGLFLRDQQIIGEQNFIMKTKYFGEISTQQQAKKIGIEEWVRSRYSLKLARSGQMRPTDSLPPIIGEPMQFPSPAVNNDTITIAVNVTDNRVGVHKVLLYYENDSGVDVLEMEYVPEHEVYAVEIPQHPYNSTIFYYIVANDTFGNQQYTPFDFLGSNSFTDDTVGSNPSGFATTEFLPTTSVDVIYEKDFHRKVTRFFDNNNSRVAMIDSGFFPSQTMGTAEFWIYGTTVGSTNSRFYIEFQDSSSTPGIRLQADWGTGVLALNYYDFDNFVYNNIVPPGSFSNNTWHRIKVYFDQIGGFFDVYINGSFYGNYPLPTISPISDISRILFRTGNNDASNNFTCYIDGLDSSWSPRYYPDRSNDIFQMIPEYHGEYTFHEDPIDQPPQYWAIQEAPFTYIRVKREKLLHKKVIVFYDGNSTGDCTMSKWFGNRSQGIVEWWINGNEKSVANAVFDITLVDNKGNPGIFLNADWSTGIDRLSYFNGTVFTDIVPSPFFTKDTWHHLRLDFDCNSKTFEIWVNLEFKGNYTFTNSSVENITEIHFHPNDLGTANFYSYIDAIDFSWTDDYYINRNLDYTTLHNFTVFDPFYPKQVKGLTATNLGIGNTLNVSWTPNFETDIEYYNLYMSNSSSGPYILKTNINHPNSSYIVSNLTDGKTYYFKVSAIDGVPYEGKNSTIKAGIPSDTTPPDKVENVSVSVINTGNELNITWDANTEPDFQHYLVYRSTTSGFTPSQSNWIANTSNLFYHDTGLVDGTTYYYKITAIDDGGPNQNEGTPSDQASGTPADTVAPGIVTGLQVSVIQSGNKLNLEWNAASGDVANYRIYRNSTATQFTLIYTTTNTWYNDTGLTDGETYWYKVAAIDEVPNEGFNSTIQSGIPNDSEAPTQVTITNVGVISSGNKLNITWSASNATDIQGYYLYNSTSITGPFTLLTTISHPTISYLHTGLVDGQIYWYKVSPYDEVPNAGDNSSSSSGIPADSEAPSTITGVAVTNVGTGNTLNITWSPSGASDIVKYKIYRANESDGIYENIINITHPTSYYTNIGLEDGQTYYYKISGLDEVPNEGINSTIKSGIPTDTIPPSKVLGVNISIIYTGNTLNITWDANTELDLLHYRIYRSTISGFTPTQDNWIANTSNLYYLDSTLTDGTTYYYKITAIDDGGPNQNEGTPSDQASGTPADTVAPGNVTGLQVSVVKSGNKLNLEWNAASGDVVNYRIYRNSTSTQFTLIYTTSNTWYNDTGLTDGETYWYKVAAIDEVPNEGFNSSIQSGIPNDSVKPNQVTGLIVINPTTGNQLDLSWNSNNDSDLIGYTVYRNTSISSFIKITDTSNNWYNDTSVSDGITYYYKISAYDEVPNYGENSTANSGTSTDEIAPEKITNLDVSNPHTGNTLEISWTASAANDFLHYRIYRDTTSGFTPSTGNNIINLTGSNNNSYIDTALTDGIQYYYRVSAVDDNYNEGEISDEKNGTSDNTVPPAKVTGLQVIVVSDTQLDIIWTPNTEPDLDLYMLYNSTTQGFVPSSSNWMANVSKSYNYYNDTSVSPGITYYYRIKAVDTANNVGDASDEVGGTPGGTPPSKVKNLKILRVAEGNALNIQWDKNITETDVLKYNVYRSITPGFSIGPSYLIASPFDNYYNDSGLTDGTTYYYRVTAVDNEALEGASSDEKNNTPSDSVAPEKVTGLTITVISSGNQLNLTWTASTAPDFTLYRIFRSQISGFTPSDSNNIVNTTNPYYLDTGLTDDITYYYRIKSLDEVPNVGVASDEKSGTPHDSDPPSKVSGLTVNNPGIGNTLNLSWMAGTATDIVGYKIYRSTISGFTPSPSYLITSTSQTNYLDQNLEDGITYYYKITAYDEVPNEGTPSNQKAGIPSDTQAPGQVTGLTVTNPGTGNELQLSWTASSATDLDHYIVYRNGTSIATPSTNSYTDSGLTDGLTYEYYITAVDEVPNEGDPSSSKTGVPTDVIAPEKVQNLQISVVSEGNALLLSWDAVSATDLEGYRVYRSTTSGFSPGPSNDIVNLSGTSYQDTGLT